MKVCFEFDIFKNARIECVKDEKYRVYEIKKNYDYYGKFNIKCKQDGKLIQNEDYGIGGVETLLKTIYEKDINGNRIFNNIKLFIDCGE